MCDRASCHKGKSMTFASLVDFDLAHCRCVFGLCRIRPHVRVLWKISGHGQRGIFRPLWHKALLHRLSFIVFICSLWSLSSWLNGSVRESSISLLFPTYIGRQWLLVWLQPGHNIKTKNVIHDTRADPWNQLQEFRDQRALLFYLVVFVYVRLISMIWIVDSFRSVILLIPPEYKQ